MSPFDFRHVYHGNNVELSIQVFEMDDQKNKDYEFVTETIKKKPINKRRLVLKLVYSVGMGLIGGIVACVIFACFGPKIYSRINPDKVDVVSIPEDTDIDENLALADGQDSDAVHIETAEADDDKSEEDSKTAAENNISEDVASTAEKADSKEADSKADSENTTDNTESTEAENATENKVTIIQKEELTLDDYKSLYRELSDVAGTSRKSLVKVMGVTDSTDWFNNSYESGNVSTGLIVADNGKELLIITNAIRLEKSKEIQVTFCDSKSYKGTVKKADPNTGLVVVAVVLNDIEQATKDSYTTAELGNSAIPTLAGTPVLAIGSPLGIEDSMAIGTVTSNTRSLEQTDSNIRYLTTDIYGSTEGSGVIIDLDGKVLGIIFNGASSSDTKNLIQAYSISDIKNKIEKLSNGQETAYLGIVGTDVTKAAMEKLSVPEGAYVKQVVVDSPAMKNGIQNGDVIVKLGTTDIRSFNDYRVAMSKCQPGDTAMVTVKRPGKDGYVEYSYEIYLEALK